MRTSLLMALLWLCLISQAQNPASIHPKFPGNNPIIQELQNGTTQSGVISEQGISSVETKFPGQNMISFMASAILTDELKNEFVPSDLSANQQVVMFPQGWSGVSSYINPDDPAIESLFAPLMDKFVIIYNFNGMYYPSQVINTLGNWDPQSGYIAKFTQETNLEFKGQITQNRTLNLTAGWNLIPVLSSCPVDVATFFQNSGVVVVKDVASWKLYWPGMGINNLYTLSPGKSYYVLMSSPAQITFTDCSTQDWECGDMLTDNRDGQVYPTVQIGAQCWMAKNLNFGSRIIGTTPQTNNNIIEKYCYNNSESNCASYGGLYQWDEMMKYSENPGDQGLCPVGWYIPPDQEWTIMTDLYGGHSTAGGALKETGTAHWNSPNTGASNTSGFTAFPGGVRNLDGTFSNLSYVGNFWTSSLNDASTAHRRSLSYNQSNVNTGSVDQNSGMSVRCRKRETLSVNPESQNLGFNNGTVTIEVTSGTSWSVQENIPWLTVEPMTGNQNGTLTVNYDINISGQVRSGEIIILADGGSPAVQISLTQDPYIWACGDTIIDGRDGNIYNTIQIGNQCWMAENLNFGVMLDEFDDQINNDITEKYCFENEGNNCEIYGGLYQWDEMMQYSNGVGIKGICPAGWHLPEFPEFDVLCATLGGYNDAGGSMKSEGTVEEGTGLWYSPNLNATNSSGFTGLPSGFRVNTGGIYDIGYYTMFWSSEYNTAMPWSLALAYDIDEVIPFSLEPLYGFSVRCLKNEASHTYIEASPVSVDLPSPSGTTVLNIQSNTGWTIEENFDWLTVEPSSGNGDAQITISFETNIIPAEREAVILIQSGERSFEISLSQQGIIPALTVTPTHKYVPQQGDTLEFVVSSNTLWTVENNETWFTVSPENGSLADTLVMICNSNDFPDSRMGLFSVTASGGTPSITISITQLGNIPWTCGDSIIDFRDSKFYSTVQIGEQCWMGQNLNVGTRIEGINNQTNNGIVEKYCYNNDEANCDIYGGLYQWDEMMDYSTIPGVQGICKTGWHLPTDAEWTTLTTFLGGESVAGGKMKETGTTHWNSPNTGASNISEFTSLPSGGRFTNGVFDGINIYSWSWSSTLESFLVGRMREIRCDREAVYPNTTYSIAGFALRCLNDETATSQLNVTPTNQDVTAYSGTTTFEVTSNTSWSVEESVSWLSVSPLSGSSNGMITVTYEANTSSELRVGQITITAAGGNPVVVVTVSQEGWSCGNSLTDTRDGQSYTTVQIGEQCWMGQNMNIGTRIDGTSQQSNNGTIEKYCYDNSETNCDVFGGLYQWNEMMQYSSTPGVQGICPTGWHVPSDAEWCTITTYLDASVNCSIFGWSGLDCGGKMKETGTLHWSSPNTGATNSSGFTAFPGGYRTTYLSFYGLGLGCNLWSSTQYNENNSWYHGILNSKQDVDRGYYEKVRGYSVRCLMDETTTSQLEVTPSNQDVTAQAGSTTFNILSNTSWTVTEDVSWLSVSPTNGNENGTLTVTYDANNESTPRVGEITITALGENPVVVVTITQAGWSCGNSLTDTRDGKSYTTIQIGDQCWMGQNLNVGIMLTGTSEQTDNGTIEKYCWGNDPVNCDIYGGLYKWDETMQYTTTPGVKGICPEGWHIPTIIEWTTITTFLGGENVAGGEMKETGTVHWETPNTGATNSSGFTALPGGDRYADGSFANKSYYSYFTSSIQSDVSNFLEWFIMYDRTFARQSNKSKAHGISVRCLKDYATTSQLNVTPADQDVTAASGTTIFEVTSNNAWTVEESVSWLAVSPMNGISNGTLTVSFEANTSSESRNGQITITAQGGNPVVNVTVTQAGAPLPTAIGENYGGGKVAYFFQPGDLGYVMGEVHGLIAAPSDQSTSAQWGCYGITILGADEIALGTGYQNTLDIVAGCSTASIAARICDELELNGYSDWFLPSKDELNKLYINRVTIGGFASAIYWSSSENSSTTAWPQNFSNGTMIINKNNHYFVRAVRAF